MKIEGDFIVYESRKEALQYNVEFSSSLGLRSTDVFEYINKPIGYRLLAYYGIFYVHTYLENELSEIEKDYIIF